MIDSTLSDEQIKAKRLSWCLGYQLKIVPGQSIKDGLQMKEAPKLSGDLFFFGLPLDGGLRGRVAEMKSTEVKLELKLNT